MKILDNGTLSQYDFEQTELPIAWFKKTSHDFEKFIKPTHSKKVIGYIYKVMYWAERVFYDRAKGIEDKATWLKFCNEIISNRTLYYKIYRGFLHVLVEIDFDIHIPDTDSLLALFR